MARTGFLWPKHLAYAVLALAVVVSLSEIGLRVYDSATGQVTRRQLYDRGLLCKSWFVHHTLRPSQVFAVKHPDRDEKIRVAINSLGYRGPEPRIPKPAGVYRVVCLGDDQTFGQAVPLDATWPARLESIWKDATPLKIEVLNAAVPGYCPLLQYLQLKLQLGSLQPDLVIAQFDPSDVAEDYACRRQLLTSADRVPLSCSHPDLYLKRGELNKPVNQPWLLPEVLKTEVAKFWTDRMLTESSKTIDSPQGKYAWIEDSPPTWTCMSTSASPPCYECSGIAMPWGSILSSSCNRPRGRSLRPRRREKRLVRPRGLLRGPSIVETVPRSGCASFAMRRASPWST